MALADLNSSTDISKQPLALDPVSELGTKSYLAILPILQVGGDRADKIAKLNEAYQQLKASGIKDPKFSEVVIRAQQNNGSIKTANPDLILQVCEFVVLGTGGFAAGAAVGLLVGTAVKASEKAAAVINRCRQRSSQMLIDIKGNPSPHSVKTQSATAT